MNKDEARSEIEKLVVKYNKIVEDNRVKTYNEEMTKKDFILPLFRALGWNVEDSREVTAEEKISKGRVDYGFRIDGISKFFLEAKSLKADLDKEEYFEQAISYAWHRGCTWAVLTDFEEIKVLNAEVKAANYLQSRFIAIKCNDFLDRFDELWLLSKESFEKGLLDEKAEKWGKKSKKASIDKQLLEDFTRYRRLLTKSITKLNQKRKLTEEELDESVQRILDRLIFIRNCEDKELEQKLLISKLREWKSKGKGKLVKSLREIFDYFDEQYNSKIFAEHLCDSLEIENEVISEIIRGLYYTKEKYFAISYDFSVIDADVLGNIYEQYLSHILKKTAKRAKVTKSGRHRKEQGIYYTPTYIVDYIVRNTLGKVLENKKVDVEKIRVLDPACGSGSFLIKAFDIFDEYYKTNSTDYAQTQLDKHAVGIPFTKKAKILQDNIFGVDLDNQAVEIAQLNLLLKIAEKGHRLPLLGQNIKCGNSLINDEEIAGDKAFKWKDEFKEIIKDGGFNVVIGNPPYVRQEELGEFKPYFETTYDAYKGTADLLVYFFEKGIRLIKDKGYFGFIASNKFIRSDYGVNLRKYILKHCSIEKIIDFGELPVFKEASTFPCIFIFRKGAPSKKHKILFCPVKNLNFEDISGYVENNGFEVDQSSLSGDAWVIAEEETRGIIEQMNNQGVPLKKYTQKPLRGILTGFNKAFVIDEETKNELIKKDSKNSEIIYPTIRGRDITPYGIEQSKLWLIVARNGIDVPNKYPEIYKHLSKYREALEKRHDQGKYWYNLRPCTYYDTFDKPKIIYGDISLQNRFTIDKKGYYPLKTCFVIPNTDKYLLALLNSKLFEFYMRQKFPILGDPQKGGRILHGKTYMNKLPIKIIDQVEQQSVIRLVDKMLSLNERLIEIGDKLTDERARIEDEIDKIADQINGLIYKIYGITKKEQKIIENT